MAGFDKIEIQTPVARAEMRTVTIQAPMWNCPHCKKDSIIVDSGMVLTLNNQKNIGVHCPNCKALVRVAKSPIILGYRGHTGKSFMTSRRVVSTEKGANHASNH